MSKNIKIILGIIIAIIIGWGYLKFDFGTNLFKENKPLSKVQLTPKIVEENLVIPETKKIFGNEGRFIEENSAAEIALVPKSEAEKVIVPKAILTVKGSYGLAVIEAQKWSSDVKLVFIKSLGAITLDGKSSQWQLAFSSKTKSKKGYEVIIQADQIVSKKEIDLTASGADVLKNWLDSDSAIKSLQELPQFSDATISSINFYYNSDGKIWRYVISTSKGTTSISAE